MRSAIPTARRSLAVGVVNSVLYAVGGDSDKNLEVVEAYDPSTNMPSVVVEAFTP
jgi:hypothetical protein